MPAPTEPNPPLTAVHLAVRWQAVCHSCGWESPLTQETAEAAEWAETHVH